MKKNQIHLILFCVMITWGFNVIATKALVEHFMPVTITAFRIFTAGVSVIVILLFLKKIRRLTKQEIKYVFYGSIFNVVLHHYFLSVGLSQTSASNGGLILGLAPLLTTILAILFLGIKATMTGILGIVLGFAGVSFVVLDNGGIGGVSIGDVYVFLSILSQAVSFILINKWAKTMDPRMMTGYMLVLGSGFLFVLSLFMEPGGLHSMINNSIPLWMVFFASAIIATAIGHMFYNYAIGQVGAAEASIFTNLNPLFALIGSMIFLGETITLSQIFGFLLILVAVMLSSGAFEELYRKVMRKKEVC
ncbi:DMT family transporter [Effusibacillus consociatus]|uniref:DMT family transporter n=1 Tax=Effusibacillus consociatus TaxID=1117041 RepID=A0ABV9Q2J9_9BACL